MGEVHAKKIAKIVEMAERAKAPIIGMWDGGGQRAHDGVSGLAGTGELLDRFVQCSGRIPLISLVLGPVVGVSALAASLADFTILGEEHGQLFLSSPLETPEVIQGEIDAQGLGGATLHASRSGIACLIADDEEDACELASEILGFLPDHNMADSPFCETADPIDRLNPTLEELVPDNPNRPYDMVKVVEEIVDDGIFLELFEAYADNIIIGFARLNGRSVGVVGNQPKVLAGCLDIDASIKAARFIRTCDAFNIPLVTFEDVPGFLPGVVQEWGGIIRHGAKLLFAYAEATVPKLTVITRKAYGGAYDVMASKHIRADLNLAWPTAEIAVMGADGAVNIIFRKDIGEEVVGGSVNLEGLLKIEVVESYQQSTYNLIEDLIRNAQATKPKIQKSLDRITQLFVPLVLFISFSTFIYNFIFQGAEVLDALRNTIAVLVIACPCALGLATPIVLFKTATVSKMRGFLFKNLHLRHFRFS